ncbi:MAG: tagaturonate reductase, partial [Lachnospiraceae bacterium]|nr:tagaturonate reductase [Lachnospiraceae bacterium]
MKQLSYQVLKESGYDGYVLENAPERVLQFGEGNFLRAFADYFIDVMNERTGFCSKVVLVRPVGTPPGRTSDAEHHPTGYNPMGYNTMGLYSEEIFREQEGLYTLYLRGLENGRAVCEKRIISCVSRCLNPGTDYASVLACADNPDLRFIICNTTEAGIVYDAACRFDEMPPASFPGKLTQFLYRRFQKFGTQKDKGFVILACELIDDNGRKLENCVLQYARQWSLSEDFIRWVSGENLFCSTLVDRIVTGFPHAEADRLHAENGYMDRLMVTGEIFASWVIEGPRSLKEELPFEQAHLPVLITDDHAPYKQRKVRILNGAHTCMAPGAYLAGQDIVRGCMEDPVIRAYMEKAIREEILPTLSLPEQELSSFARSVTERFQNPFIDHALLSICLNSTAKWRT